MARPARYEHHLMVCATIDGVQLEVTTASEPLYFNHINLSDEYAMRAPDRRRAGRSLPAPHVPVRPGDGRGRRSLQPSRRRPGAPSRRACSTGQGDFARRSSRSTFRRECADAGLSSCIVQAHPRQPTWCPLPRPVGREEDAKAYMSPAPPMVLASMRGEPGVLAHIGRTTLAARRGAGGDRAPHGGWVVVLEAAAGSAHAACDLLRLPEGTSLDGAGIVRALLFASNEEGPGPIPRSWSEARSRRSLPTRRTSLERCRSTYPASTAAAHRGGVGVGGRV